MAKRSTESTHVPRPRPVRTKKAEQAIARSFARVRDICLAHEHVYEKDAWSESTYRVERGKMFVMCADNHHDDGRVAIWCRSTLDAREAWQALDSDRFFVPPYVGPSGWIGVRLEGKVPWDIVEEIVREGVRLAAPKKTARKKPASNNVQPSSPSPRAKPKTKSRTSRSTPSTPG